MVERCQERGVKEPGGSQENHSGLTFPLQGVSRGQECGPGAGAGFSPGVRGSVSC